MPHFEIKGRSIAKAITWKIIAILISWGILYYFLGESRESLKISLIAAPISVTAYYLHERMWNKIHWGKEAKNHDLPNQNRL